MPHFRCTYATRGALKFFREVNKPTGGRLIQVSSCLGQTVEEVDPAWNIKVTIVEHGPFRSNIMDTKIKYVPSHPAYADPNMDGDPYKAAEAMDKLAQLDDPPLRLPLHKFTLDMVKSKLDATRTELEKHMPWPDDICLD
ncbi:hypothetical protein CONPUDRAFT_65063 [Coniophora puteana RWD-64-598 SS2]|uniref:NAD(P)-binding protein n=1 Tax=Coniophora puteana (strain RWD-64-598) TaxID=741705 RepID=A0A5M3M9P6_CONPW|nr:uncharacterized protein CONPUDRAFT_65063 [Coniophora puteana RWD-64-598 SS2]EIW75833.1 hypothetical protein CONPUDRAFT_65063 [Coniophora puteana RWD-64-598 SS2]